MIPPGFYGVADAGFGDPVSQARLLAEEGVGVVQLRCKGWPPERVLAAGRACLAAGVPLVINDHLDVARVLGVPVHLGQDDGADPDHPFGRSCHTVEQVRAAGRAGYLGFGPVFPTGTKATGYDPRGLEALAEVVRVSPVPVVAIGGIDLSRVEAVRATGVHAWALISAVWTATDPRSVVRDLRA